MYKLVFVTPSNRTCFLIVRVCDRLMWDIQVCGSLMWDIHVCDRLMWELKYCDMLMWDIQASNRPI